MFFVYLNQNIQGHNLYNHGHYLIGYGQGVKLNRQAKLYAGLNMGAIVSHFNVKNFATEAHESFNLPATALPDFNFSLTYKDKAIIGNLGINHLASPKLKLSRIERAYLASIQYNGKVEHAQTKANSYNAIE
ncbi:MAG: type IX secretion system membrane protein PorP/SprF, partial [Bacteroidales bacterium]|nr:type IX secretion system membrane protein PorP/SprF [Bacteroidales bacterium]